MYLRACFVAQESGMSKAYERQVQTSETLIEVVMIRLLIARQGRKSDGVQTRFSDVFGSRRPIGDLLPNA